MFLTCVICKILKSTIHSLVMKHFDEHHILADKQHGFRRGHSCETQLIATIEGIASQICSGKHQVDIILLNFSKAFDKLPHQLLLHKLEYYGVRGGTLSWIRNLSVTDHSRSYKRVRNHHRKRCFRRSPGCSIVSPIIFRLHKRHNFKIENRYKQMLLPFSIRVAE